MEVEDIQTQGSKFPRISNFDKLGGQNGEEDDESKRGSFGNSLGRFCGWPQSRIVRVSRSSGGKDRHSKVLTSKGLRDRRVRLSVHTAIQFYDLQDRLGYDQPSKAVEWLLKAAANSIDELPALNTSFPNTPNEGGSASAEADPLDSAQPNSSNSETSKGSSGHLSLVRSENRIKARERAKERRAEREKEREIDYPVTTNQLPQSSFTELLTGAPEGSNFYHKQRPWGSDPPMDYFYPHGHHQQEMVQFPLLPNHLMPTVAAASSGAADLSFTMSSSRGTLQSNSPQSLLPPHHHNHLQRLDASSVPIFIGTAAPLEQQQHHHHQFPSGFQLYYGDGNGRGLDRPQGQRK